MMLWYSNIHYFQKRYPIRNHLLVLSFMAVLMSISCNVQCLITSGLWLLLLFNWDNSTKSAVHYLLDLLFICYDFISVGMDLFYLEHKTFIASRFVCTGSHLFCVFSAIYVWCLSYCFMSCVCLSVFEPKTVWHGILYLRHISSVFCTVNSLKIYLRKCKIIIVVLYIFYSQ